MQIKGKVQINKMSGHVHFIDKDQEHTFVSGGGGALMIKIKTIYIKKNK